MTRDPDIHAVGDVVVLPDGRTSTVKQVTRPHGVVRYLVHGRPGVAYTGTDADDALYTNPYGNKVARDTVALTVTKAF